MEDRQTVERMKEEILEIIKFNGDASFAMLDRRIEGFRGELGLEWEEGSNIFLWFNVSRELKTALAELLDEQKIYGQSTVPMVYLADGAIPRIKTVGKQKKYKNPRWLPFVFYINGD